MYTVILKPKARKSLEKLPPHYLKNIFQHLKALEHFSHVLPSVKKLAAVDNGYRLRVGDYRILFQVNDASRTITVYLAGHRKDIYRNL